MKTEQEIREKIDEIEDILYFPLNEKSELIHTAQKLILKWVLDEIEW